MAITEDDVARIARLARLELGPGALTGATHDLAQILDYVETLASLDLDAEIPMCHVDSGATPLRDDVVVECAVRDAALDQAPRRDGDHILVPKVV